MEDKLRKVLDLTYETETIIDNDDQITELVGRLKIKKFSKFLSEQFPNTIGDIISPELYQLFDEIDYGEDDD